MLPHRGKIAFRVKLESGSQVRDPFEIASPRNVCTFSTGNDLEITIAYTHTTSLPPSPHTVSRRLALHHYLSNLQMLSECVSSCNDFCRRAYKYLIAMFDVYLRPQFYISVGATDRTFRIPKCLSQSLRFNVYLALDGFKRCCKLVF